MGFLGQNWDSWSGTDLLEHIGTFAAVATAGLAGAVTGAVVGGPLGMIAGAGEGVEVAEGLMAGAEVVLAAAEGVEGLSGAGEVASNVANVGSKVMKGAKKGEHVFSYLGRAGRGIQTTTGLRNATMGISAELGVGEAADASARAKENTALNDTNTRLKAKLAKQNDQRNGTANVRAKSEKEQELHSQLIRDIAKKDAIVARQAQKSDRPQ